MTPSAATVSLLGLVGGLAPARGAYPPSGPDVTGARPHEGATCAPQTAPPVTVSTVLPAIVQVFDGVAGMVGAVGAVGGGVGNEPPPQEAIERHSPAEPK